MTYNWQEIFRDKIQAIGDKAKKAGMVLSMHPGQYTVLNSLDEKVIERSVEDLNYHLEFLELLNTGREAKIVVHIGGVYGNKQEAINRFIKNYEKLNSSLKERLVIENDHKSYHIDDVLYISSLTQIPVVYDVLHNKVLNAPSARTDRDYIIEAGRSWKKHDGKQKIHYSQQDIKKSPGSHSLTINLLEFKIFYEKIMDLDIDIILEVKDKNLSAIKVNNFIYNDHIKYLEKEWAIYKYSVLEKSNKIYNEIRKILKDKKSYPVIEFYKLIDQSRYENENIKSSVNALEHVWGYFKNKAELKEYDKFQSYIKRYKNHVYSIKPIKNYLYKLSLKYDENYLLSSLFFESID